MFIDPYLYPRAIFFTDNTSQCMYINRSLKLTEGGGHSIITAGGLL